MLKICLCSDNHGDMKSLDKIRNDNLACDYYIHCGDSSMCENDLKPFVAVKGNNDWDYDFPRQRILEIGGHRILVSHGHNYTSSIENLVNYAKTNQCDVLFFGHTHEFLDEEFSGVRLINPGSCFYNRDMTPPCYAIVEIDGDKISAERIDLV